VAITIQARRFATNSRGLRRSRGDNARSTIVARARTRARTHAIEYRRWVDDLRARFRFGLRLASRSTLANDPVFESTVTRPRDYIIVARFGGKTARRASRLSAEKPVSERAYIGLFGVTYGRRVSRRAPIEARSARGLTWITPISALLVTLT